MKRVSHEFLRSVLFDENHPKDVSIFVESLIYEHILQKKEGKKKGKKVNGGFAVSHIQGWDDGEPSNNIGVEGFFFSLSVPSQCQCILHYRLS